MNFFIAIAAIVLVIKFIRGIRENQKYAEKHNLFINNEDYKFKDAFIDKGFNSPESRSPLFTGVSVFNDNK